MFVLLPGGTFWQGAQKKDEQGHNYDENARSNESDTAGQPVSVTLSALFLSRYEMTQGQWRRLTAGWTADREPSRYRPPKKHAGHETTLANPVERLSWEMCDRLMTQHGLVLPTEAQWEYACRAGSDKP